MKKRYISLFLLLSLFVSFLALTAQGAEVSAPFFSQNVSEEEKSVLLRREYYDESMANADLSGKTVLRTYRFVMSDAFNYSLEELIERGESATEKRYFSNGEVICVRYGENGTPTVSLQKYHAFSTAFLAFASLSVLPSIPSDYTILDVYVFLADTSTDEKMIYYVTDQGIFAEYFDARGKMACLYKQEDLLTAKADYEDHIKQTGEEISFEEYFSNALGMPGTRLGNVKRDRTLLYAALSAIGGIFAGAAVISGIVVLKKRSAKKNEKGDAA